MNVSRIAYCISRLSLHPSCFLAPLVFLASATLYVRTTCPTLGGAFDSEEFQHAAYTLAIAHATGYPFYLLVGKIFTTLVPIGNIAYRMNLLSALTTAGAVTLVYLNAQRLTRRSLVALTTAALFATNVAVWRQAGVASIGPLHLLLLNAILYATLLWQARRAPLASIAFLFGLGLAHHRTTLLFVLPITLLVWLDDPDILYRPRELARVALAAVLPLTLYLYLPIFGNHSPWYSNTVEGFLAQISGGDAGDYLRATPAQILEGLVSVALYLNESFSILGSVLVALGAFSIRTNRQSKSENRQLLFLGVTTLLYSTWGTLYAGEPDRYLVLPFVFLVYWFALGLNVIQARLEKSSAFQAILAIVLILYLALPFPTRLRAADWSTFDRVYKTWDEIFSLPIPPNATIVGNWGQLNAMRYMQRVEQRRPDLQAIGTLYDPTPQTKAAHAAFADGRAIFLAPGVALPYGEYRYTQLGPLLEVRDAPQTQVPTTSKNIVINSTLTLAHYEITTALESYAPTTRIAPNRTARVTLDWQANSSVQDFLVRVRVYDAAEHIVAQKDEPPVRGLYSPSRWSLGEYVRDVHNILIPAGTPPGVYRLTIQTLDAHNQTSTSEEIALASFQVTRATNLTRDQVFVAHALTLPLNDSIELWGYGGFESTQRVGETLRGNLVFFVRRNVGVEYTLTFALRDGRGTTVQTWTRAPIAFYPTHQWQRGEILKAYYSLHLAADLSVGTYTLAVGLDTLYDLAPVQVGR